ncbi:protein-export chaperone SecB [Chthonobacter rhizosphaerae]|uniref:protein-export chaperone SecB n=1 Tax=Chthonobacter rhizosphaerae TaxID=2735553 RepID=UPI0015EEFA77|nr:protein-export chaperone SecB [Chthonobacter rhizosphaerae]
MTDTQGAIQQPSLNVLAQYLKDLSFENPKAPDSLRSREGSPEISVGVNVSSRQRSGVEYEVDLKIEVKAEQKGETVFQIEMLYGGLFRVQNVPQAHLHPFVMIECPRLLFPFARQIVADASVRGGFPPLMIDPIDFVQLYQQYLARMQAQAQVQQ